MLFIYLVFNRLPDWNILSKQLSNIAKLRRTTVFGMIKPFLCTLAPMYLAYYEKARPSFDRLLNRLWTTNREFFECSAEIILPKLIQEQNSELLQEIAVIMEIEVPMMCINETHSVLAHLFVQDDTGLQDSIRFFLSAVSANHNNITMASLLRSCSLLLVTKLAVDLAVPDLVPRKRVCIHLQMRLSDILKYDMPPRS